MGKSLFFVTKCNEGRNHGHGRGSAPYRHSDSTSCLWAMSKSDCLKQRASVQLALLKLSLLVLLDSLASPSNARKVDLEAGPLDTRLNTDWKQPSRRVQDCAKAVTSQNQQHHPVIPTRLPSDVTQQRREPAEVPRATRGNPRAKRASRVFPEQRVGTHAGNETKATACLSNRKQVPNRTSTFDWTGKFDLNAVTKPRHLSWSFLDSQVMK